MNQTGKYYLVKTGYDDIVTTNQTLSLDSGWYDSYPGTGTNWYDLTSNFYNATLVNSPSFTNGNFTFDGSDDYGSLNLNSGLLDLGTTFTLEAFMKLSNTSQTIAPIYSSLDVNVGQKTRGVGFFWGKTAEYGMNANAIRLQFGFDGWSWQVFASNGIQINDTNWHHVAYTSDATDNFGKFYVDGVLQSRKTTDPFFIGLGNTTPLDAVRTMSIGRANHSSLTLPMDGSVGLVKVYKKGLNAVEVFQDYNATKGRFGL
jgi:hypothetical protein